MVLQSSEITQPWKTVHPISACEKTSLPEKPRTSARRLDATCWQRTSSSAISNKARRIRNPKCFMQTMPISTAVSSFGGEARMDRHRRFSLSQELSHYDVWSRSPGEAWNPHLDLFTVGFTAFRRGHRSASMSGRTVEVLSQERRESVLSRNQSSCS
jgi:hypothetical protein